MLNKKAIRSLHIAFLVVFAILFINIIYISVSGHHLLSGANIKKYDDDRSIKKTSVAAKRGAIYDRNGEVIAKDTNSYTIIAYLNKSRIDKVNNRPAYVTDPKMYAKKLAPILKEKESNLYKKLSQTGLYQTQLGVKAKDLSLTQKEKIDALKLNGIEFETNVSRSYPNGIFASSTIGYSTFDEKQNRSVGKLGVEATYDDQLRGKDGSNEIEVDGHGYTRKVLNSKEAVDGSDVYLTLDNNIQRIVESNMEEMFKTNKADVALAVVADAKTNEILALSNRPTFNPNKLDIKDYTNPFVSLVFEPGSTMKTFTYASAMDSGVYKGNSTFYSGPTDIKDNGRVVQTIKNYENYNWGTISYNEGFMRSSNTGIINLFMKQLSPKVFEQYLGKFGFFKKTGIDIPGENNGRKVMNIKQEKYTTGFGQASSITPVQLIQAFSSITNKGKMMQPYITSKLVDSKGKIVSENKPKEVGQPISEKTSKKMLKLMSEVVENPKGTGYKHYQIDNYKIAGKTGTAEYVKNGKYQTCSTCYYTSFLMAAPASNPDIIVYLVTQNDASPSYAARSKFTKNVTSNTLAYLNSKEDKKSKYQIKKSKVFEIESFINKSSNYAKAKINKKGAKAIVIGEGGTIINQTPTPYSSISNNQNVFLLTKSNSYEMIDLSGYSKADVLKFTSLLGIKVDISGSGYVKKQSIKPGTKINEKNRLKIKLG